MTDDPPTITMANNKNEMLAAYQEMKRLLQAKEQEVLSVQKERERFRQEAARATAERAVAEDPVRRIQDLRAAIGRDLGALAEQFDATTQEYAQLKEAVAEKQAELQRIYEVETAAADLAALIEAHRQKRAQLDADLAEARLARENEQVAARAAWEKEQAEARAGWQREQAETRATWQREEAERAQRLGAEQESIERQRQRDREEYDYALARERAQRRNSLEDELAALSREIAGRREEAERDIAEREADLSRREAAVAQREQRVGDLEARVAAFPDELAGEVARAVETTTQRLKAEAAGREALLKSQHEGERNVLTSRIEALQQLVERQSRQVEVLTAQQERAYAQVQDIASKAVDSARHVAPAPAAPVVPSTGDGGR